MANESDILEMRVWVICKWCRQKHILRKGLVAPVYQCGSWLKRLVEGDDVEYEEEQDKVTFE